MPSKFFGYKISIFFVFMIGILPFMIIATYNIPYSDEFSSMYYQNKINFWDYQKVMLNTWTGRYIANLLEIIYPTLIRYFFFESIALVTILLFVSLSIYTFYRLFYCHIPIALLLTLILINGFPSIADIFYYSQSIFAYTISLLLIYACILLSISKVPINVKLIFFGLINLILLGLVELYFGVVLFSTLVFFFYFPSKKLFVFGHLIVYIFIICIICHIHGNQNRYSYQHNAFDVYSMVTVYIKNNLDWIKNYLLSFMGIFCILGIYKNKIKEIPMTLFSVNIFLTLIGFYISITVFTAFISISNYPRIGNILYFFNFFVILYILIYFYKKVNINIRIYTFTCCILLILTTYYGNIFSAVKDYYNRYSYIYTNQVKTRYQYLEVNRGKDTVHIPNIYIGQSILKISDVNDGNNTLVPEQYQYYFEIKKVIIDE